MLQYLRICRLSKRCLAMVAALLMAPAALLADWINLTGAETAPNIAEIVVADDAVEVAFEIYPDDRDLFLLESGFGLALRADAVLLAPEITFKERRERKDRYSPFAGMVDPRTRRLVPGPPESPAVIYVELRYPFSGRPKRLELIPPMSESGVAAATIGFLLYHKAAPVTDFRYLSKPESLTLDWDDPWYTSFDNPNLTRHHRWPQMTFLYIEPRLVRHESLVRVRDLMKWTQESPDVHRALSPAEQEQLKSVAGEFFAARNPVAIDGRVAQRVDFRAEFLDITTRGLQVTEPGSPVDASGALLGISERYAVEHLPDHVTMDWELFDERVDRVPTSVIDPAGPFPGFIEATAPRLEWTNFIRDWQDPALRPIAVENGNWFDPDTWRQVFSGVPADKTAAAVIQAMLRRLAIAFLEWEPARQTGTLSVLVDGTLLSDLQPELERIYAIPTTGGGVASITAMGAVTLEQLDEGPDGAGFSALVHWQAEANGQHWGHVDRRRIEFRALLDVADIDGYWKLRGLTVLEAQTIGG